MHLIHMPFPNPLVRAVCASWCRLLMARRFDSTSRRSGRSAIGTMWSTTSDRSGVGDAAHASHWQNGRMRRNWARSLRQTASYPRPALVPRAASWILLTSARCFSHLPPLVSSGQPGTGHGRFAAVGIYPAVSLRFEERPPYPHCCATPHPSPLGIARVRLALGHASLLRGYRNGACFAASLPVVVNVAG